MRVVFAGATTCTQLHRGGLTSRILAACYRLGSALPVAPTNTHPQTWAGIMGTRARWAYTHTLGLRAYNFIPARFAKG
jgi:hypothetical protein